MKNEKFYFLCGVIAILLTGAVELISRNKVINLSTRQLNIERRLDSAHTKAIADSIKRRTLKAIAKAKADSVIFTMQHPITEHSEIKNEQ